MKANPNLNLLRRLRKLNFGFEACSGGELERAILAGTPGSSVVGHDPNQIVMHGPGKLEADFVRALEVGATVALDSINESSRIAKVAPKSRVLIRVNPGLRVSTHDHLATGNAESKFGGNFDRISSIMNFKLVSEEEKKKYFTKLHALDEFLTSDNGRNVLANYYQKKLGKLKSGSN